MSRLRIAPIAAAALLAGPACRSQAPLTEVRVSGYVEATDVQVSAEVGGRVTALDVTEGTTVKAGTVIARIDPADIHLALRRAQAERQGADAQVRLLLAGARIEDVRQADAQRAAAEADLAAARRDLAAAERDLERFEALLATNAGAQKPRDDAAARRDVARERVRGAEERVRAAGEGLGRLRAGARKEEIEAARARVAVADALIATLEKNLADTTVTAPADGVITQKLVDQGELVAPRAPIAIVSDLVRVWANVYVDEPLVPRVALGQKVVLHTDAGDRTVDGTITYISPKAEFTPRNVQTAAERSKLVYRVKVSVENTAGILKQGMPVEAVIPLK